MNNQITIDEGCTKSLDLTPIGCVERDESDRDLRGDDLRARPARIILDPAVLDGLLGLEAGSDVLVLCYFHQADRDVLLVHPRGDLDRPLRGVFATRSPARPNPIAVTSARIQRIDGNVIHLVGLDALDGSLVLDIKSLAPTFHEPYR
jgi:tRNA-Thr(GGU) m(6)t(6)A37 methyltransferase TsaA